MHKDDLMTPVERAEGLARGESVDRLPISLFYKAPGHSLLGWTRRREQADAHALVEVQKRYYEVFGCDSVSVSYGLHGMAVAFGARMSDPDHQPLSILEPPVRDIGDLSLLDLDRVTVETDPTAKMCYEAALILREELGHEVRCGMGFPGVFTAASGLVGTERLLKSVFRNPEQARALLSFVTEALLQLSGPFVQEGFGLMVADPVASGTMISKRAFREYVLPYSRRFVDGCKKHGPAPVRCHICGNTTEILDDIVECGYGSVSLDNVVDLTVAKERIGGRVHLLGNVDPVDILFQGSPAQVKESVRECFRKAWDSPCGYTIGIGCDASYGTPLENALAYMAEARKCARYPVKPENFE